MTAIDRSRMGTLTAAFRDQARACSTLGSPFTARILELLAGEISPRMPLAARLAAWPGDISARGAALALRLAGGLHAIARAGTDPGLTAIYCDPGAHSDAALLAALRAAMARRADFLDGWLDRAPQTNEIGRAAVVIAAAQELAARFDLPIVLSELGASAGLNLWWDRYALKCAGRRFGPAEARIVFAPDWQGPAPPAAQPRVVARAGVDLSPIDPQADRERLLAYIWADQAERLARTEAALDEAARGGRDFVHRGDAIEWLEQRLAIPMPGRLHLVFNTVAWQYFPPERQLRGDRFLATAGARAASDQPLAHLAMEATDDGPGATVTLRLWDGGRHGDGSPIVLGRSDFHGRWIRWNGWSAP